ncbi:hypothetical protein E2542_SST27249 [Spatholobus suberectus]|nr:hypothetical protein E2542_SST27249 [Spatholobus suberectus]
MGQVARSKGKKRQWARGITVAPLQEKGTVSKREDRMKRRRPEIPKRWHSYDWWEAEAPTLVCVAAF